MSAASTLSAAAAPLDLGGWRQNHLAQVEQALSQWVGHGAPAGLGEAMRYAVLDGGKRLRPLLVLAADQAGCSGQPPPPAPHHSAPPPAPGPVAGALRPACAVNLPPAFSLVHADLPCREKVVRPGGNPPAHVR